jgi:hypothetical protein
MANSSLALVAPLSPVDVRSILRACPELYTAAQAHDAWDTAELRGDIRSALQRLAARSDGPCWDDDGAPALSLYLRA